MMPAILDDGHENYANVNEEDETDLLVLVKAFNFHGWNQNDEPKSSQKIAVERNLVAWLISNKKTGLALRGCTISNLNFVQR